MRFEKSDRLKIMDACHCQKSSMELSLMQRIYVKNAGGIY